jgi:hypothetical protein
MPLILTKGTFVFENDAKAVGWTESYYGLFGDLPTAFTALVALANLRAKICVGQVTITYVRVATVGVTPAASIIRYTGSLPGGFISGKYSMPCDYPDVALQIRVLNATATKSKNIFSRGQPDDCVIAGSYVPVTGFATDMRNFLGGLANGGWGWLGGNVVTVSNITAIVSNAAGLQTFTLQGAPYAAVVGKVIQIRNKNITGARTLNGLLTVRVVDDHTVTTIGPVAALAWTGGGTQRYVTKSVEAVNSGAVQKAGERKCGRPLYHSRGRQPARVRG